MTCQPQHGLLNKNARKMYERDIYWKANVISSLYYGHFGDLRVKLYIALRKLGQEATQIWLIYSLNLPMSLHYFCVVL